MTVNGPATNGPRLDGKVAFITGATQNIGFATARAFALAGADLVITARTEADLATAKAELEALGGGKVVTVVADVLDDDAIVASVDAATAAFGGVDVLVNNAAASGRTREQLAGLDTSIETWNMVWQANLLASYRHIQLLAPTMKARGGGSVVNILSIAMSTYMSNLLPYSTVKGAIATLTRYLAVDLAPDIRVNGVSPGAITPTGEPRGALQRSLVEVTPMQRAGAADEIASTTLFLASEASSFVTGQIISVDGGIVAHSLRG